jgi:hypothetical protein
MLANVVDENILSAMYAISPALLRNCVAVSPRLPKCLPLDLIIGAKTVLWTASAEIKKSRHECRISIVGKETRTKGCNELCEHPSSVLIVIQPERNRIAKPRAGASTSSGSSIMHGGTTWGVGSNDWMHAPTLRCERIIVAMSVPEKQQSDQQGPKLNLIIHTLEYRITFRITVAELVT